MKTIKIIFSIIILAIIGFTVFSCTKDIGADQKNYVKNDIIRLRNNYYIEFPPVKEDRYVFRDFDHLTEFYNALSTLYEENVSVLDSIVSRNENIESIYSKVLIDSFSNPLNSFQPFMTDPIMRIILNQNYEFEIENVLVTYMNNSELLICDPNDRETQMEIRNLEKGGKLDFSKIPSRAYWGEDTNETSLKPFCACKINIEKIKCDSYRIYGTCGNFAFGAGGGIVNMWMDNSPGFPPTGTKPKKTWEVEGNFDFTFKYTSPIALYIHVSADPNCIFNNVNEKTLYFDPNEGTCDFNEYDTGWKFKTDNSVQGMKYRVSYYRNFWSSYSEAEMYSVYLNGSTWKENKKKLFVGIDENRRTNNCELTSTDDDTDDCSNCSHIKVRVNSIGEPDWRLYHCDGDVIGKFRKIVEFNGTNWLIEDSLPIDFDCCNK